MALTWFFHLINFTVLTGYGMTETTGRISCSSKKHYKVGCVGKPLNNVQIKIPHDGEILVKGKSLMMGYLDSIDNQRVYDNEGWLCTGDIGSIDSDGFLIINDRKKRSNLNKNSKRRLP